MTGSSRIAAILNAVWRIGAAALAISLAACDNPVAPAPVPSPAPTPIASATLTALPPTVAPGGTLRVTLRATGTLRPLDWIGLFRVGDPNTHYRWWEYTKAAASGGWTTLAPEEPGMYEFRYLLNDGYDDIARSNHVTVAAPGGGAP